ncbi:MAG: PEP-CTERM sorting domain-containing protein [Woeseia sp.]
MNRRLKKFLASALVAAGLVGSGGVQAAPYQVGDVFAALAGAVQHYDSSGTLLDTYITGGGSFNTGMAFDATGNLYVTNFGINQVARLAGPDDPHTETLFATQSGNPEMIVFDASGNAYVSSANSGLIAKYGAAGGAPLDSVDVGARADFIDLAADQNTLYYTTEGNFIGTYDFAGDTDLGNFASGYTCDGGGSINTFALRLLDDGGVLAAVNSCVARFDSAGNKIQEYDAAGVSGFFALNLDADGTSVWSGSFNTGTLYKFDIDSGALLQTINTSSSSLFGVAVFGEVTQGAPPDDEMTVPEPGTLLLLGATMFGFGLSRGRRRLLKS